MAQLTPMMQQYMEVKNGHKDCILFYRLGDFYEMFFEDALTASKELEITLTGRDCGQEERAPMCGVPYHAAETYLNRLVAKGYKVAICEQVEDAKPGKGIVKREVIRIVTPGTNLNAQALDEDKNNYIMCIVYSGGRFGVASADISTGAYMVTEIDSSRKLLDEINRFSPSEIICNEPFYMSGVELEDVKDRLGAAVYSLDSWYFDDEMCARVLKEHFQAGSLEGLGLSGYDCGMTASGALLQYLYETQKTAMTHLTHLKAYSAGGFMMIDNSTRRNLELVETLREKQKRGSLLWVLDKTKTAMGARMMRSYVEQPLIKKRDIDRRLDALEELNSQVITREELREYLHPIYDLERLLSRVTYRSATPRDLVAFKHSIAMLPHIKLLLRTMESEQLKDICDKLDTLEDLHELIDRAILEEPALAMKEGGIIEEKYNAELDKLRDAKTEGKSWLAELEAQERESTGIKNLKIKYNKVFGYHLEVTNSYKNLVPDYYTRKQTLANAERYIIPRLKELEDLILGAEDKQFALEYELFCEIREKVGKEVLRIQKTAGVIAQLDVLASFALVSERNGYVRPEITTDGTLAIKSGRHPVVEKMITNDMFIANDTYLDNKDHRISIITGPNMAGKSTYMRQAALIVLMAQIGCFVPAEEAKIGIVDRIFTRVGASDDLASGQSTFMVEMTEVANILRNATRDSLLILDEIGRGTSTFDGLSIAWAVVEHISNPNIIGAKTLFATHYHELTELEGKLDNVNNYCIAVKEQGDNIVFLRKIVQGGADKSYGIQVAKLAGVPDSVIERAKQLAEELSNADIAVRAKGIKAETASRSQDVMDGEFNQISLFDPVPDAETELVKELKGIDISRVTPIEALNILYELQSKVNK